MGISYGRRRGRLERIRAGDPLVAYALGRDRETAGFEHADYELVADFYNRRLDEAERRFRENV